jgi:multiple sugar transport system permease protein
VRRPRRAATRTAEASTTRGIMGRADWRQRRTSWTMRALHIAILVFLLVAGLGPILWMLKSSITPTQDTLRAPMALWPHGFDLSQLATAWSRTHIDRYLLNTVVIAFGSWAVQIVVATTAGFALSVLKPRGGRIVMGLVLATLFVPPIVLLVPLYLTVLDVPIIHLKMINSYWAIWLPAGASAINIVLMKRFFDNLPREIFDAARVDGAGGFRLFRYIVLPMSRPILGVVSVFAVLASWKDFLWPLLVISDADKQPLSVRLPSIQPQTDLGVFLAALLIASLGPIIGFLIFQRSFLRGGGLGGAIKG